MDPICRASMRRCGCIITQGQSVLSVFVGLYAVLQADIFRVVLLSETSFSVCDSVEYLRQVLL